MANPIDFHAKLMIGDLVLTIARQAAELEALRESQPAPKAPKAPKRPKAGTPA